MKPSGEQEIRRIFLVSVILKGLDAALEIALGVLLFFPGAAAWLVWLLTHGELAEDPTDFFATHLNAFLPYLYTNNQLVVSVYLFSQGLIKIFLVWGLLRNKLWAYPAALVFLLLFIAGQLGRFAYTGSAVLLWLTAFDVLVLWLVGHEYDRLRRRIRISS